MDSTASAQAAHAVHDKPARDASTVEEAANSPPTLPLELVLDTLKLSLEGYRSGSDESRRALYTYSLISKGVSGWAQKKLFHHLCLPEENDALDVPHILSDRPELSASVRVIEIGEPAWSYFKLLIRDVSVVAETCPAYARGELTLKLPKVDFNFGELHGLAPLIGRLILDHSYLQYDLQDEDSDSDSFDYAEASSLPPPAIFPRLKTLEVSESLESVNEDQLLDPADFPALKTIIYHPGLMGSNEDPRLAFKNLFPHLTSLFIKTLDDRRHNVLSKCNKIALLDLPLNALVHSGAGSEWPLASSLPSTIRTLRIRLTIELQLDQLKSASERFLLALLTYLKKEGKEEAKRERLVLPEELQEMDLVSWGEFMRVVESKGVVVDYEEVGAEDDVEVFEALRRKMGLA